MVYWQPGTQYNYGDVVTFEGNDYKIIQPHRSQSDWTPPVTPALWGRMQKPSGGHGNGGYNNSDCIPDTKPQECYQPPAPAPQPPQQPQQHYQQPPPQYSNNDSKHEGGHSSGCSDDGDKKSGLSKKLGIAGGIAAGAALLGAGLAVYKHKKDDKEIEAERVAWLTEAQKRTDEFKRYGPRAPTTWILNNGKTFPSGAIVVGGKGQPIYISRAFHKGSLTPGGASESCRKGAIIGYAHDEIHFDTYEILLGDMEALRWVSAKGKLNVDGLGYRPVEGGHDTDGSALYVARAFHKGDYYPGKAGPKLKAAFIPYDDDEEEFKDYEVLCYNN